MFAYPLVLTNTNSRIERMNIVFRSALAKERVAFYVLCSGWMTVPTHRDKGGVRSEDRPALRFVWRTPGEQSSAEDLEMTVHVFGAISSPTICTSDV